MTGAKQRWVNYQESQASHTSHTLVVIEIYHSRFAYAVKVGGGDKWEK